MTKAIVVLLLLLALMSPGPVLAEEMSRSGEAVEVPVGTFIAIEQPLSMIRDGLDGNTFPLGAMPAECKFSDWNLSPFRDTLLCELLQGDTEYSDDGWQLEGDGYRCMATRKLIFGKQGLILDQWKLTLPDNLTRQQAEGIARTLLAMTLQDCGLTDDINVDGLFREWSADYRYSDAYGNQARFRWTYMGVEINYISSAGVKRWDQIQSLPASSGDSQPSLGLLLPH